VTGQSPGENRGSGAASVSRNGLSRELKTLRRDEGRTLLKLLASPQIRAALGTPTDAELVMTFDTAVAGLGNDRKALALKNAYAIGLRAAGTLTERRENFGSSIERSPDTVKDWEDEQIEALVARLLAGDPVPVTEHLMVAVAVSGGRIVVVAEGESEVGKPMRQWANPNPKPFLPGFLYMVPNYLYPSRLTISVVFLDEKPLRVRSEATGDLLAFVCGDEHQVLEIVDGGLPGIEATAYAAVHWDEPLKGVYYGVTWA
jgi:hypothetical protein